LPRASKGKEFSLEVCRAEVMERTAGNREVGTRGWRLSLSADRGEKKGRGNRGLKVALRETGVVAQAIEA
jgi:hypothetical protein